MRFESFDNVPVEEPIKEETGIEQGAKISGTDISVPNKNGPEHSSKSFDPEEEVMNILKLPTSERGAALSRWKEKYAEQKTQLASLQADLIGIMRKNPETTKEELMAVLEERAKEHAFTEEQMKVARSAIEICDEKHKSVVLIREKYPDDKELFKAVFGIYPIGKVAVEIGLVSLNFKCNNSIDFERLHHFDEKASAVFLSLLKGLVGAKTRGVSIDHSFLIPELRGSIIAEDLSVKGERGIGNLTVHEEQHALRLIFQEAAQGVAMAEAVAAQTEQDFFILSKQNIEEKIEDELLAFLKSGSNYRETLRSMHADYIDGYIAHEKIQLRRLYNEAIPPLTSKEKEFTSRTIERLESPEFLAEMKKEILSGVRSYEMLRGKLDISDEETAALLAFEPLSQWPKLAERLISQAQEKE